jgi:hypothetical protein
LAAGHPDDHNANEEEAVKSYRRKRGLSLPQRRAVELEFEGHTSEQIGLAVGVTPGTVRNWRWSDLQYRAAVNRLVNERIRARARRLDELEDLSIETMRTAMENGDAFIAMKFHSLFLKSAPSFAAEDETALVRQRARDLFLEEMSATYASAEISSRMHDLEDEVRRVSLGWEAAATAALDAVASIVDGPDESTDLDVVVRASISALQYFLTVLRTSEGEGLRAFVEATDQDVLPDLVRDISLGLISARLNYFAGRQTDETAFRLFAASVSSALRPLLGWLSSALPRDLPDLNAEVGTAREAMDALGDVEDGRPKDAIPQDDTPKVFARMLGAVVRLPLVAIEASPEDGQYQAGART